MSRAGLAAALLAVLAGGACVPAVTQVEAPVRATLRTRLGDEPRPIDDAAARAALAQPLTRAVIARLALTRSPRIAAALAELGVAAGAAAAARALGRTDVDASAYFRDDASLLGGEVAVVHDVIDLILLAPRRRAGDAQLAAAQARAAAQVLGVVARADLAFLTVAAAAEELDVARIVFDAAAAGAELVERLHASGGVTELALVREQSQREEARLGVARAEVAVEAAREELNAALGLSGADTRWSLGEGVPALPEAAPGLDDLERTAVATSLELAALRADALGAANRARTAGVKAWLPELGAGVVAEYSHGGWFPGPTVRLGLPLGSGERGHAAAARAETRRVAALTLAIAIEVRAQARATRLRALAAYDEARHLRDVLVPLRRRVLDETVLQYNAMNAGPLELLAARRELAGAERLAIDARRRYAAAAIAVAALRRGVALGGGGDGATTIPTFSAGATGADPGGHR